MRQESGNWKIDLHCHAADIDPSGDAQENIPPLTYPVKRKLFESGEINADLALAHEGFPIHTVAESRHHFKDVPVLIGIEVSAQIPPRLQEKKVRIPRMVHVNGIFEDKPQDWPFKKVEWERSYWRRWKQVATLPAIDEVIDAIARLGGIAVIPHPSPWKIPWASLWLSEAEFLKKQGVLTGDVALELNGHWLYRGTNKDVKEFADRSGLAIVGGSDAHTPASITRYGTIFQRRSENIFTDLKTAISEQTTQVVDNIKGRGVIFKAGISPVPSATA